MNKRRVGPVNHAIDSHYCMSKCFRHVNQHNYLVDFRIFPDSQRLKGCRLRTELISKGFKQDQYTLVSWNLVQQIYFHLTAVLIVDENLGRKKRIHYCPTIYILLKAEAQRIMLLLSHCATLTAMSFFFFFSFLKYNLSYNFKMVFTIFSPINVAHYLFIYFHYHPIINLAHYLFIYFHYHPIINLYN